MATRPQLPSILSCIPGLQDVETTPDQINSTIGRITTPEETPIYICVYNKCCRLFPSQEKLMVHKKREHGSEDAINDILTWNH